MVSFRLVDIDWPIRVEAGRLLVDAKGKALFSINKHDGLTLYAADTLTHFVCELLNGRYHVDTDKDGS